MRCCAGCARSPDAQFQTYATRDVAYIREHFFGTEPALVELAKLLTDAKIAECFYTSRGGHEARKVYAAYRAAVEHKGAPTVILAQTVKGYTLGKGFESKNANHQMKKLSIDEFKGMRELLGLPIPDSAFQDGLVPYGHPGADSPEVRYLQERRAALGGPAPAPPAARLGAAAAAPRSAAFTAAVRGGPASEELRHRTAFVRLG
ncbi:pyruvate dehydrogenase E1 component [Streptomyces badius]